MAAFASLFRLGDVSARETRETSRSGQPVAVSSGPRVLIHGAVPLAGVAAMGAMAAFSTRGRPERARRPRAQLVLAARESEDQEVEEDYFESAGGSQSSRSPRKSSLSTSTEASQLDVLSPSSEELVNVDVPNHYLNIHRSRPTKSVRGGPAHVHGRSKRSKQKVQWRLKQGPPLAHKNWDFPSRLRVSSGIAKRRRLEQPAGITVRPTMERVREALFNQVTSMHLFEDRSVRVLDLFAGTGSLGIEALSRGASECIYVDTSKECVDCCIANSWLSGFMEHEEAAKGTINERLQAEVAPLMMVGGPRAQVQIELHRAQVSRQPVGAIEADVLEFLQDPEKYGLVNRSFNLVMCSPNFNEISYRQLCTALAKSELIECDALVCIEYPREIGVLPPVLCAPFDDPEDYDDIANGVPILHGLRNREYGSGMLAVYCKLPTGARGRAGEPRPWEFTETLMQPKLRQRSRDLWRTPSIFANNGERGFAVPKQAPQLNE